MKFKTDDRNPTYAGRLTLTRENSRFEITRHSDGKVAFANRLPRRDSKVWSHNFLVWSLADNCQARASVFSWDWASQRFLSATAFANAAQL